MSINDIIETRRIREIVHFTTHTGLLGTLHSRAVKSRKRLPADVDLRFIYKPNAIVRRDPDWLDFINLSISRINKEFFNASCRWHRLEDLWWCIMSFEPEILTHANVYFTTTNNMYSGVRHVRGASGLEALFAPSISRWTGNVVARDDELPENFTTCEQAEVLYPAELSIRHLRGIYAIRDEDADEIHAQIAMIGIQNVEVRVAPDRFI